jgi:hypothetical protein
MTNTVHSLEGQGLMMYLGHGGAWTQTTLFSHLCQKICRGSSRPSGATRTKCRETTGTLIITAKSSKATFQINKIMLVFKKCRQDIMQNIEIYKIKLIIFSWFKIKL